MTDPIEILLENVTQLIEYVTKFWPANWKNTFRNKLIEWLQENL